MANQIQIRRDSSSNWSATNPILANGELGYDTTLKLLKVGDNSTAWNSLSYVQQFEEYRDIFRATSNRTAIASTGQFAVPQSNAAVLLTSASGSTAIEYIDTADYNVTGRTTQYRIVSWSQTETAPTSSTITVALYPVSSTSAGVITVGTVVSGSSSTTAAITAANTRTLLTGTAFTAPAAGYYVVVFSHSVNPGQTLTYGYSLQVRVQ